MRYAKIAETSSGLKTIVAAVSGCKIRVISYLLSTDTATTLIWKSDATALSGSISLGANAPIQDGTNSAASSMEGYLGLFETIADEALKLNIADTAIVGGYITYITIAV